MNNEPRTPRIAPLVSILISTYNRAGIVGRAIRSILDQDFQDWEVIVVGHCTPDNTAEVVAAFKDPRIQFHNMPDRVPDRGSATKNYGIKNYARGTYIAYLDDDDRYKPQFLSTMIGYMIAHPDVKMAYCRCMYRDHRTGRRVWGNPFQRWMHGYSKEKLQRYNFIDTDCVVHTRALMDEVGYWKPEYYFNDYELWLRISAKYEPNYVNRALVEKYVDEPPFLKRLFTKGWQILRFGRTTPFR